MKILSKKKYSKLLDDFKELKDKCKDLERVNRNLEEKLGDKKTSYKVKSFVSSVKIPTGTKHIGEEWKLKNAVVY